MSNSYIRLLCFSGLAYDTGLSMRTKTEPFETGSACRLTAYRVLSLYGPVMGLPDALSMSDPKSKKLVIKGVTDDGQVFRPSDWAERMSGNLSTFRNRRIYYSPLLRPAVRDGIKCIVVDTCLADQHPKLFEEILGFARTNALLIEELAEPA